MTGIKLFVGLGNIGEEYSLTRHNIGFCFNELILQNLKLSFEKNTKLHGFVKKLPELDQVILLNPSTYMNESGIAVQATANYFKIKPEEIMVIHDDLDLLPGKVKLKLGGGHGGHNGLKSIIKHLGTNNFWRIRIGIGHPGDKTQVNSYVLKKPSKQDNDLINNTLISCYQNFSHFIHGNFETAMLNLHTGNK